VNRIEDRTARLTLDILSVRCEPGGYFVGRIRSEAPGRTSFHVDQENVVMAVAVRGKSDQFAVRRPDGSGIVSGSCSERLCDPTSRRNYKKMAFKAESDPPSV
jgi:hypothetical protein